MNYTVQQSSPGIQNIMDAVKSGQAKLVTAYPVAGSWNNAGAYSKYSDTPSMTFEDEYGQVSHGESQNLLYMNGKLYLPNNDWSVIPVTKQVRDGDEYYDVPNGQFRIRERANGNVFNDFYIAADGSGQVTGYSPTLSQSGSNSGWGGGFVGNMLGGLQELATSSPVVPLALAVALPGAGTAIGTALGLEGAAATIAGNTIIQSAINGGDVEKALVNSVIGSAANAAGTTVNTAVDEASAAANYGTNLGSQQTAMLAAQEAGMGTLGDITGNVAGNITKATTGAALKGQDLATAAEAGLINAGTNALASAITSPSTTPSAQEPGIFEDTTATAPVEQTLASTVDQEQPNTPSVIQPDGNVDAQGNPTYVNEQGNPVDVNGTPIANANQRTALEGGGFKTLNPDGSITYEDPDGSVYKVNPDGTYTTQSLGNTNTYNPTTGEFTQSTPTPPATAPTTTPSTGLSEQQISNILKAGTGLLTGAVVAPAVVNALTGSGSSTSTPPATVPTTGTNAVGTAGVYSPEYFQQIQQNYNRLFPTAPADIATPLQSWYTTKYVPDTSISNKLFGV
jgi:hypothetical protein